MITTIVILTIIAIVLMVSGVRLNDEKEVMAGRLFAVGLLALTVVCIDLFVVALCFIKDDSELYQIKETKIRIQLHEEMELPIIDVDFVLKVNRLNSELEDAKESSCKFFEALCNEELMEQEPIVLPEGSK